MGWGTGNIGGGPGGGGLNFTVVGDTTAPTNPKENTIWVETDTDISNWIFDTAQPDTTVEGTVWIYTGTESRVAFNALKKNGIRVYPISAKQYVNGAWETVTVETYQGGVWKRFGLTIYESGVFADGFDIGKKSDAGTITATKNAESITCKGGGNAWHIFYVTPSFSPGEYSTLKMLVEDASGSMDSGSGKFGLASSVSDPETASFVTGYQSFSKFSGSKTFAFDLSAITGTTKYYVALRFGTTDTTFTFNIKEIWLE